MSPGSALGSQLLEVPGHPSVVHSEHEELSENPECARDAGAGLGCGRHVPTAAAQIKHVPFPRSTPCPCQPVVLKISICGSTVLFCFPSSSSQLTWTLISFPSTGIIHGKQRDRSKFPFSQLCQKASGALPPCRGTRSSGHKGEDELYELLVQGETVLW